MRFMLDRNRPSGRSRGINNGLNLCYQNAGLQALMHQPPFMNWVMHHNPTVAPCNADRYLKCHLRALTRMYWGSGNPTNTPIAQQGCVQDIADLSYNSMQFVQGEQEDANIFFNWVIDSLRTAPT